MWAASATLSHVPKNGSYKWILRIMIFLADRGEEKKLIFETLRFKEKGL